MVMRSISLKTSNKPYWPFFLFLFIILSITVFVLLSKHEKQGVVMLEKVRAWGDVSISKYKFSNGLTVILAEQQKVPLFAYQTWFHVGSRREKNGKTGIAHFFEHLLFKETKNLKEGEFDRIMEENGASTNAGTWVDWTYYYETLPADPQKIELVIKLESDRMRNMILNERQIESERGVIMNERRFRVDNDVDGSMSEALDRLAYDVHPYGLPTIGWMEDIQHLSLEDCIQFYKTYYSPNNATIVVVGNIDAKQTLKWIEQYYGVYPAATIPPEEVNVEPPQKGLKKKTLHREDIDSEKVIYAYHATEYGHKDTPTIELLGEILFNGEGSRLYRMMVTNEEIAADVHSSLAHLEHPSLFQISVAMRKGEPLQKSHNRVLKEIKRIQDEGVTEKELERAKNRVEMDYWSGLGTVSGKARALGNYEVIAGDYKEAIHLIKQYQSITTLDIQRVAKQYLNEDNLTRVEAKPKK